MLPYGRQWIDEADIEAVTEVLSSDWLTTGPWVRDFEQAIARQAHVEHAVSCTSGTAALHIAYAAAGLGPGDEVVTTPMTYVATASGAMHHGATIVFADIEADTGNIDPAAVEAAMTDRTKVVAGVDYAGQPVDADRLNEIAHRAGALTLQDAAHSIGSTYKGRPVGSLSDLTTYSFFPTKNMTTAEGGAIVTDDAALALRADEFHKIGVSRDRSSYRHPDEGAWWYEVPAIGLNYRLSDVHAALGLSQLGKLADFKARRAERFARYQEGLAGIDGLRLPTVRDWADPTWHLYPVRVLGGRRREVFDKLREAGIGVQVNYIPVYWHPVFEDLGYRRGMCPNAEQFYSEEISLPMFAHLELSDQDRVIDTLRSILGA
ncbi:UDP-4-amino-4,6-dideoxy-N-acetyl-beta-L-altrosamine transaminase [Raineyella antarctica]|uniref:UDP-4-amino-4,6-dideoxy-N-acetyl-beta-L-altrosamine transaminase n=1 Tax=Raineyella antarctica TaxID=1577474 RepID=A0A1G6GHH0_9ACTN|nr:UDP-4-amino-4,6-dideoxy-N-acetyl-beta-L-altrosamine transaminase [Raineyella antarctica]SDB80626.1 UDP-4-amino-4,6-dideoxy-N-acetyl-beta-L-altrosamine transaminase [Raineyella antarctica]